MHCFEIKKSIDLNQFRSIKARNIIFIVHYLFLLKFLFVYFQKLNADSVLIDMHLYVTQVIQDF